MKKWSGKVKVFGPEEMRIFDVDIKIPERLYARAIKRSEEGKPLSAAIYAEISKRLEKQFKLKDYLSEFDDEDNFCVEDTWVVDPVDGELMALNERYAGKRVAEGWDSDKEETKTFQEERETCETCSYTYIDYAVNNHGILVKITSVRTRSMEYDDVKGGAFTDDYPKYSLAEELFDELVSEFEDYDDSEEE